MTPTNRLHTGRIPALRSALCLSLGIWSAAAASGEHWPQWRGPNFNGMAVTGAPTAWSETENIKWKTNIPGRGHSTPVIWGNKILLTTAIPTGKTSEAPQEAAGSGRKGGGAGGGSYGESGPTPMEHELVVMCLDKSTGKLLWRKTATTVTPHEGFHRQYGSFASNSPSTDGERVYAFFGSNGVYAYDLDGNLQWKKDLGVKMQMRLAFGEGTGTTLHDGMLILNFDHQGPSFIVALNAKNGSEIWRAERDEPSGWTTPLVIEFEGRKQVVVSAQNKVRGYDLNTGKLIWECGGLGANPIPAPVYADGMVWVMTGYRDPNLLAIKLGREGDLTGSDAIVWTNQKGNPYSASPVLHGGKLYMVTDNGFVSCFNAKTGEAYYQQQRLPKPYKFKASPVGADGKLYLASEEGDMIVLKMGEKYEVLATNSHPDQVFISSPVVVDNEIYLRGSTALYAISNEGAQ